jgi:hypothetical protein
MSSLNTKKRGDSKEPPQTNKRETVNETSLKKIKQIVCRLLIEGE